MNYLTNIAAIERDQATHEALLCIAEWTHTEGVEHRYWRNRARIAIAVVRRYERTERAAFEAAVARSQQHQTPRAA